MWTLKITIKFIIQEASNGEELRRDAIWAAKSSRSLTCEPKCGGLELESAWWERRLREPQRRTLSLAFALQEERGLWRLILAPCSEDQGKANKLLTCDWTIIWSNVALLWENKFIWFVIFKGAFDMLSNYTRMPLDWAGLPSLQKQTQNVQKLNVRKAKHEQSNRLSQRMQPLKP